MPRERSKSSPMTDKSIEKTEVGFQVADAGEKLPMTSAVPITKEDIDDSSTDIQKSVVIVTQASDQKVEGQKSQDPAASATTQQNESLELPADTNQVRPAKLLSLSSVDDSEMFFTPSGSLSDETFKSAKRQTLPKNPTNKRRTISQGEDIARLQQELRSLKKQQSKQDKHIEKQIAELREELFKHIQQNQNLETEISQLRDKVEKVEMESAQTVMSLQNSALNGFESFDPPQDQELDGNDPAQTFLHISQTREYI